MKKRYVVAGILAAAGLICGGIAYYQYYQDAHAGQEYEKIKEKVVTEEPEETPKSTVEIPIDFQTLQNMNPDIYAWIKVPGTVIDYPIAQSETDNSYYLNHSVEHDVVMVAGAQTVMYLMPIKVQNWLYKTFLRK